MNKRITSLLLCFLMVFSMLTTTTGHTHAVSKPTVSIEASVATAKPGDEVELTLYFQSPVDTVGGQVFVDLPEGLTYVSCNLEDDPTTDEDDIDAMVAVAKVKKALGMSEGDVDWVAASMQMFFTGTAGEPLTKVADAPVALATIVCKVDEDAASGTYNIGISSKSADGTIVGGIGDGDGNMLAESAYNLVGTSITVEGAEPAGKPVVSMEANKETAKAGDEVELTLYFQSDVDTVGGQVFVALPEGLTYVSCDLEDDPTTDEDDIDAMVAVAMVKKALGMSEGDVDWVAASMQMFFTGTAGEPLTKVADAPVAMATIVCKVDEDAASGTYNIGISSTSADGEIVGGIGDGDGNMLADSEYDLVGTSIEVVGAAACNHEWSTTLVNTDPAGHYYECSKCGEKKDEKEHSATDDKDCTTADLCSCGYVVTAAGEHTPEADDGDCQTPVGCTKCDQTVVAAKTHVAAADDNDCTTPVYCTNEGCTQEVVPAEAAHVAGEDDGDCTTAVKCVNCDHICVEAKDAHVPGEDDGDCTTAVKCVNCDHICVEAKDAHVPGEDDGDCTTAVKCVNCDQNAIEAKDAHVAEEDDGDCSTAVKCANCDQIVVEAKNHDFSGDWHDDKAEGHYHSCGNEGCEATDEIVEHIPGPPATPAEPQVCTECGYVLAEATNQFVNSAEATVTKPVIGKTPDYNVTIKSNPAGKAELNRIVWYKIAEADYTGTNEDSWTTVDPDEVFEAGYVYSCDIYLDTVDGYWVAEDITGKVNGKAHDDSYGGVYGSETEIYLAQDFKPIDPSNPQTGDNSNMTLWIAMLVLSGAGVIGTFVYDRKKKRV